MKTADTEHYVIRADDWRKAMPNSFVLVYHGDTLQALELGIVSDNGKWLAFRGQAYQITKSLRANAVYVTLED